MGTIEILKKAIDAATADGKTTRRAIAEKAGMTESCLSILYAGKRKLTLPAALHLADALGIERKEIRVAWIKEEVGRLIQEWTAFESDKG